MRAVIRIKLPIYRQRIFLFLKFMENKEIRIKMFRNCRVPSKIIRNRGIFLAFLNLKIIATILTLGQVEPGTENAMCVSPTHVTASRDNETFTNRLSHNL